MSRKFKFYDRTNRPKLEYPKLTGEYTDYELVQRIKKTGDGEEDFEIYDEVKERKVNIKEFINSFKGEVGVENIVRRMIDAKDVSILNQTPGVHMDTTIIPEDPEQALALATGAQAAYNKIDPELRQGLSIEQFIQGLSADKIDAYIKAKVEQQLAAKKGANTDEGSK